MTVGAVSSLSDLRVWRIVTKRDVIMHLTLSMLLLAWFVGLPVARAADVDVTRFGATPDDGADDTRAIQRAIDASKPGDAIRFPAGAFDCSATIFLRSGRTYQGAGDTTLRFNELPADTYGVALLPNCADVTFDGYRLIGGGIRLSDGERYRDIRITNNEITQTAHTPGLYVSIPSDRLIVERNRFHDYDDYGVIAYHINECSVRGNVFHNIQQGAHLLAPRNACSFSFNYGTRLTRMGLEVQRMGDVIARDMVVEGNVFFDWKLPFRDSFGLSIVADESVNTRVVKNYVRADHTGPWNDETERDGQGRRFGYGIEAGFTTGVVEGNLVGGPWANHIVVSHKNTPVRNNKLYGKPVWKIHIAGEPGPRGTGTAVAENNLIESNLKKMPAPPEMESVVNRAADSSDREKPR
jgi:hypothetical protein